jgi:hypothetical protein
MRAWLALALLAVPLLAGCTGSPSAPSSTGPTFDDLGLKPTASTGIIRGVVVDEAIRPIAGATIVLNGEAPREAISTADGLFGFADLAPGTYFLAITKAGYFAAQQSTEVVAGIAEPPIVKVQLRVDVENQPFFEAFAYEGFVECTTSLIVLCGAPNDRFTWNQYLSDGADVIQSEMVWDSTQALSPQLYFEMEALEDGCTSDETFIANAEGPSPIYVRIDAETVAAFALGETCPIYYSIFAGDATGGASPLGVGATLQQRFNMFIHAFHGYLPPETWRFSSGEAVPQPDGA